MTKKQLGVMIGAVAIVALLSGGCGQRIAEQAAERAIENSAGSDADVDIDNGTLTANVNGSTIQVGTNSWPENFPSDVYRVDGTVMMAASNSGDQAYVVSVRTDQTPADLDGIYRRELGNAGWSIIGSTNYGGALTLIAQKNNRTLSISLTPDEVGKAVVTMGETVGE